MAEDFMELLRKWIKKGEIGAVVVRFGLGVIEDVHRGGSSEELVGAGLVGYAVELVGE